MNRRHKVMNSLTEDVAEAVVLNFRRLLPAQRRHILQQLIADLDLPLPEDDGAESNGSKQTKSETSGNGLLAWLEERSSPTVLATVLATHLPGFSHSLLTDSQQRHLLEQQLTALSPLVLYQLHRQLANAETAPRLTPEEIVASTWGTIGKTEPSLLREIIEDEEYCGY
jgi:hypothetical protein